MAEELRENTDRSSSDAASTVEQLYKNFSQISKKIQINKGSKGPSRLQQHSEATAVADNSTLVPPAGRMFSSTVEPGV